MNLEKAPVQLIVAPIWNSLLDIKHVVLQSVRTLQPLHERYKTFEVEKAVISMFTNTVVNTMYKSYIIVLKWLTIV